MSKFIEALTAFGEEFREYPAISTKIKEEPLSSMDIDDRKRYIISVKWSALVECKPKDLPIYIKITKKQLKHDVYDDLISMLKHLHIAILEGHTEGIKVIFEKIWEEVS